MNLYLATGFHLEHSIELLQNMKYKTARQILNAIAEWKKTKHNKDLYRIEPYDRFTFYDDSIVIDFGDYYTFIKVTDMTKDEMKEFKEALDMKPYESEESND